MIGGLGKIDVEDWKMHTRLKHCTSDSNIVKWFWRAVESFDDETRARCLQFVTGSSRVPLQGFKALQGKKKREHAFKNMLTFMQMRKIFSYFAFLNISESILII